MKLKSKSTALVVTLFLGACGGGAIGLSGLNSLGSGLVSTFNASPNSEPLNAQDVNIAAVSFATDPFNP